MTEEQILGFKPAAGLDQVGNECCERVQDRKHRSQRCDDSALSCESRPDRIFGRDRFSVWRACVILASHASPDLATQQALLQEPW